MDDSLVSRPRATSVPLAGDAKLRLCEKTASENVGGFKMRAATKNAKSAGDLKESANEVEAPGRDQEVDYNNYEPL
jgi:hypothetical protein